MRRQFSKTNNVGRVADALESAQSENTRKSYASQFGKFRSWCEQEGYSPLPAQSEVPAGYAAELADDVKSMSTIPTWRFRPF